MFYFSCSTFITTYQSNPAFALAHALPQDSESFVSTPEVENALRNERLDDDDDGDFSDGSRPTGDLSDGLSGAEQEHLEILQAIYDRLTEIENKNGNTVPDGDVDIHVFRQEVILPELEGKQTPEGEVHGMIRAFRDTDAFKRAYRNLDDEEARVEVDRIIASGDESGSIGELSDGLDSNSNLNSRLEGTNVQSGRGQAAIEEDDEDEEETVFGRRLRSSSLRRRTYSADDDPALLCEDENCDEKVEVTTRYTLHY